MTQGKQQCSQMVHDGTRYGAFNPTHCAKPAIVEREGKWYCKIHDPEYQKQKRDKRDKKWKDEFNKRMALSKLEQTAVTQCREVNPDNPQAVAENIKDAFETLKNLAKEYRQNAMIYTSDALEEADKVLAKMGVK